jgi:hypothetical protein
MQRFFAPVLLLAALTSPALSATRVPIDPALFSIESTPGVVHWDDNTLTLDLFAGGPLYGGFTQTRELRPSFLPDGITGISFELSSTLAHPRISFGMVAYNETRHGEGSVNLNNYLSYPGGPPYWDLTTFVRHTTGLGGGRTTLDAITVPLGSNYDPFSLVEPYHDPITSYPYFSLDFRADGYDGTTYLPGKVTFRNIEWLVIPEPSTALLTLFGMGSILVWFWRVKRSTIARRCLAVNAPSVDRL